MKILWFTLTPCGSVRRFKSDTIVCGWLVSLEDELKKKPDVDLHVAYFSFSEREEFCYEGVHYHPMLVRRSPYAIIRLVERLKSEKSMEKCKLDLMCGVVSRIHPDMIHVHGTEECFALIQNLVRDIPIVISIQGLIAPIGKKYFSGIPFEVARSFEPISYKLKMSSVVDDYKSICYRGKREERVLKDANYIMGRTFWDEYISLVLNPNRQYFVVNEILRGPFYEKRWNAIKDNDNGRFVIISTVSGGIYKGIETLLYTARILKEYADFNFEWRVAGYDRNNRWLNISLKMVDSSLDDLHIKLLGRLDANLLSDELVKADAFVHVSHIENSPNSVCEAMLVGMPVIASYAGGTASLIRNGEDGILVQDGDPYVLAGAIEYLYHNPQDSIEMGRKARATAIVRHNQVCVARELTKAYDMIHRDFCKKKNK